MKIVSEKKTSHSANKKKFKKNVGTEFSLSRDNKVFVNGKQPLTSKTFGLDKKKRHNCPTFKRQSSQEWLRWRLLQK